ITALSGINDMVTLAYGSQVLAPYENDFTLIGDSHLVMGPSEIYLVPPQEKDIVYTYMDNSPISAYSSENSSPTSVYWSNPNSPSLPLGSTNINDMQEETRFFAP